MDQLHAVPVHRASSHPRHHEVIPEDPESEELDSCHKKTKTERNNTILRITYIGILLFSLTVIVGFIVVQVLYIHN